MSTINLPKVRACSDITFRVSLEDNGVALDWTSLSDIKALIYSDVQKAIAGRCTVEIDSEDSTILVCTYAATKPQYLGINSIIVRCNYRGREKTYDKQAVDIVARTSEATGVTTIEDPVVDVDINVEDVSTSILDNAIAAAIKAAEDAEEAAHLVPLQVLEDCRQATIEADAARDSANEAAEAALAAGEHAVPIIIEGTGTWGRWDESLGRYVDTGLPSRGIQGPQGVSIQSVEQTQTSQESQGVNEITVTLDNGQTATFQVRNGAQGATGAPGVANAKYKQVSALPVASAATMDYIYLVASSTAGIYDMSYTEYDPDTQTYSWHSLGTTAIQLTDYATEEEVSQLGQKVAGVTVVSPNNTHTPFKLYSGKTYRFTNTAAQSVSIYLRVQQSSSGQALVGTLAAGASIDYTAASDYNYIYLSGGTENTIIVEFADSANIRLAQADGERQAYASINSLAMGNNGALPFAGRILGSGKWNALDSATHRLVIIKPGDVVKISGNSAATSYYAFLRSYEVPSNGTPAPLCVGTSRFSISRGETAEATAPNDAKFLYIAWKDVDDTDRSITSLKVNDASVPFFFETIKDAIEKRLPAGILKYDAAGKKFEFYSQLGSTNKYFMFRVRLDQNDSDLVYLKEWRWSYGAFCEYDGVNFTEIATTAIDAENEMAMYFRNAIDYTGGIHGDERIDISPDSFVKFFADGKLISDAEMASSFTMVCASFDYMQLSSLHQTSEVEGEFVAGHPIIAMHYKRNTFANCESELENRIIFTTQQYVTQYHAGLMCVGKGAATYALLPNAVATPQLTGTSDLYNADNRKLPRVDFWNPANGLRAYVEGHMVEGIAESELNILQVWDRTNDTKYYRRMVVSNANAKEFNEGDVIINEQVVKYY